MDAGDRGLMAFFQRGKDLCGMTIDLYLREGAPDDSISSNYKGAAFNAHELAAVK